MLVVSLTFPYSITSDSSFADYYYNLYKPFKPFNYVLNKRERRFKYIEKLIMKEYYLL